MRHKIYWLHLASHTDILTEGYVGITSRGDKRRLIEHKTYRTNAHLSNAFNKYGKDVIQTILLVGDKEYCQFIEERLRPIPNIGWNIAKGGGIPPSPLGRKVINRRSPVGKLPHTEETKQKISAKLKGRKLSPETLVKRSKTLTGRKRKPFTEEHRKAMSEAAKRRYQT